MTAQETAEEESITTEMIDIPFAIEAERSRLDIQTGPIQINLAHGDDGGLGIIQSGDMLYLIQGLLRADGTKANIGQDLTPSQARALAKALDEAADAAEDTGPSAPSTSIDSDDGDTIMEKIAGVWQ